MAAAASGTPAPTTLSIPASLEIPGSSLAYAMGHEFCTLRSTDRQSLKCFLDLLTLIRLLNQSPSPAQAEGYRKRYAVVSRILASKHPSLSFLKDAGEKISDLFHFVFTPKPAPSASSLNPKQIESWFGEQFMVLKMTQELQTDIDHLALSLTQDNFRLLSFSAPSESVRTLPLSQHIHPLFFDALRAIFDELLVHIPIDMNQMRTEISEQSMAASAQMQVSIESMFNKLATLSFLDPFACVPQISQLTSNAFYLQDDVSNYIRLILQEYRYHLCVFSENLHAMRGFYSYFSFQYAAHAARTASPAEARAALNADLRTLIARNRRSPRATVTHIRHLTQRFSLSPSYEEIAERAGKELEEKGFKDIVWTQNLLNAVELLLNKVDFLFFFLKELDRNRANHRMSLKSTVATLLPPKAGEIPAIEAAAAAGGGGGGGGAGGAPIAYSLPTLLPEMFPLVALTAAAAQDALDNARRYLEDFLHLIALTEASSLRCQVPSLVHAGTYAVEQLLAALARQVAQSAGDEVPSTHNLRALAAFCRTHGLSIPSSIESLLREINFGEIRSRKPSELRDAEGAPLVIRLLVSAHTSREDCIELTQTYMRAILNLYRDLYALLPGVEALPAWDADRLALSCTVQPPIPTEAIVADEAIAPFIECLRKELLNASLFAEESMFAQNAQIDIAFLLDRLDHTARPIPRALEHHRFTQMILISHMIVEELLIFLNQRKTPLFRRSASHNLQDLIFSLGGEALWDRLSAHHRFLLSAPHTRVMARYAETCSTRVGAIITAASAASHRRGRGAAPRGAAGRVRGEDLKTLDEQLRAHLETAQAVIAQLLLPASGR